MATVPKPAKKPSGGPMRKAGKHYSERKDLIIREIIAKMLTNEWVRGLSHFDIAKRYKMHPDTAAHYASEAGRILRMAYSDKEDLKVQILALLDLGSRKALEAERNQYDQQSRRWKSIKEPNLKALRDFVQLQAEVHGLVGSAKPEPALVDATGQAIGVDVNELNNLLGGFGYEAVPKTLPPTKVIEPYEQSSKRADPEPSANPRTTAEDHG